jgi:hypothetical protein
VTDVAVSVIVPLEGVEAKLNIASQTPTEQSKNPAKMRGLKNPNSDVG